MKDFIKITIASIVLLATMTLIALGTISISNQPKTYTAETITYSDGTTVYAYYYK